LKQDVTVIDLKCYVFFAVVGGRPFES